MQSPAPVNRPVEEAASYYNSLAPWYDLLAGSEKKFIRAGLKLLNPQTGESILEIGFGTGYAQKNIAASLKNGVCAGVDLSPGMARVASKKLRQEGLADAAHLSISDSLPLPFASEIFDGAFSSFTLELFDTPLLLRVLEECCRVLKPTGRLVVVSLSKDTPLPWAGRLYEALHNRYPRLLDCRPIPVLALLEQAGFQIREHQLKKMWGLPVILVAAEPAS